MFYICIFLSFVQDYVKRYLQSLQANETSHEITPLQLFQALGRERAFPIGHSKMDMILYCLYEEQPCKEKDFVLFQFPSVFNCYTFKRGRSKPLSQTAGVRVALSMILYHEATDDKVDRIDLPYNKQSTVDGGVGK